MDALRREVTTWLAENWEPSATAGAWWKRCAAAGWIFPTWPVGLGGRGLSVAQTKAVYAEFVRFGALGPPRGAGQQIAGPVVLAHGDAEQRARLLAGLITGEEAWCQLFSEPAAGSDLASVRMSATRDGGRWLLNGQKTWVTGGRSAQRGFVLARSDAAAAKHKGLSYFIVDLNQPGVDVRALETMNGWRFDELFFDDVVVEERDLIGAPGDGWSLAMETLRYERQGLIGRVKGLATAAPGAHLRPFGRPAGELIGHSAPQRGDILAPRREWTAAALAALATERQANTEPVRRQALVQAQILSSVTDWSRRRDPNGVTANLTKLAQSHQVRLARDIAPALLGAHGTLSGPDAVHHGAFADMVVTAPSQSLVGGTDEIQRNIIAERGLGLPREPAQP